MEMLSLEWNTLFVFEFYPGFAVPYGSFGSKSIWHEGFHIFQVTIVKKFMYKSKEIRDLN